MTTTENIRRPSILGDDHRTLYGAAQFVCRRPTMARRILPASILVKYSLQLSLPSSPVGMIPDSTACGRSRTAPELSWVFPPSADLKRQAGASNDVARYDCCRFGDVDHKVMTDPLNGHDLH